MEKGLGLKAENLYPLFAEILEYPTGFIYETFDECLCLLWCLDHESAGMLKNFDLFLARAPLIQVRKTFTGAFGLSSACPLSAGDHLFDEGERRRLFLAGLKNRYQAGGFSPGREPPDSVAVILRFLADGSGSGENDDFVRECLVPALNRMISGLDSGENPYRGVLQALRRVLGIRGLPVAEKRDSAGHGEKSREARGEAEICSGSIQS